MLDTVSHPDRPDIEYPDAPLPASLDVAAKLSPWERLLGLGWLRQTLIILVLAAAWEVYGRFIDRLAEVGAHGDIMGLREYWAEQAAAAALAAASPSNTSNNAAAAAAPAGAEAASK